MSDFPPTLYIWTGIDGCVTAGVATAFRAPYPLDNGLDFLDRQNNMREFKYIPAGEGG